MNLGLSKNTVFVGFKEGQEAMFVAQLKELTLDNRRAEVFGKMVIEAMSEYENTFGYPPSNPFIVAFVPDTIND